MITFPPVIDQGQTFNPSQGIVRIAAVQYLLRDIENWEAFAKQVRLVMKAVGEYKPQFVLFPEILTTQLLSFMDTADMAQAVRALDAFTARYVDLFTQLAAQWNVHIIAGSHPTQQGEELLNLAYLFTPGGKVFTQPKIHLTRWEKDKWNSDPGHHLRAFDTPYGRIGILICYDVEFPELSRLLCQQGVDILFVPSCTDDRQGYWRVRYCCHARAIENQVYVAMTGTVGQISVEGLGLHFGQAAIITPSDFPFARDGIAAEGSPNMEQIVVADVDLAKLASNRINGTTIPLHDKRIDVYDSVVEVVVTGGPKRRPTQATPNDA
ncbi:MAG: carbon-nitrogen hydrolase family protein [Burkholderiales bacterium]|nr:carbon-nitrogen hydrolase family protein [Burkholderiales bacterium]